MDLTSSETSNGSFSMRSIISMTQRYQLIRDLTNQSSKIKEANLVLTLALSLFDDIMRAITVQIKKLMNALLWHVTFDQLGWKRF